ncbi:MAG: hypothetical protein K0R29_1701 [Pseudobdellovibrio sp.]|nr:hypothetical protein [Pseudobdellovibrio sp.]
MWYVFKPVIKTFLCGAMLLAVAGCGQPSGNAPGAALSPTPSPVPITTSNAAVMKYGEAVTTAGGWTVSIDNSDPVESAPLANGWTVEVLSE